MLLYLQLLLIRGDGISRGLGVTLLKLMLLIARLCVLHPWLPRCFWSLASRVWLSRSPSPRSGPCLRTVATILLIRLRSVIHCCLNRWPNLLIPSWRLKRLGPRLTRVTGAPTLCRTRNPRLLALPVSWRFPADLVPMTSIRDRLLGLQRMD